MLDLSEKYINFPIFYKSNWIFFSVY